MANGEASVAQSARISSPPPGSSPPAASSPPPGSSPSPAGSHDIVRYGPPIIIALLLAAVIAGIRAAGPAVAGRGPWRQDALAIGIGVEVALAGLQVALAIRSRRSPEAGRLSAVLRMRLRRLTAFAMIAIIAVAGVNLAVSKGQLRCMSGVSFCGRRPDGSRIQVGRAGKHLRLSHVTSAVGSYLMYTLIALVVLAAAALCLLVISRARKGVPGGYAAEVAGDDSDDLRKAVESGAAALQTVDDARAAIISCYVAMEDSLAGAGAARNAAETPDELLARAVASGVIHGPAAASLTALFYEARFSSHPLADAAKRVARQALDAISAELRDKQAAAPPPDSAQPGPAQQSQPTGRAR